MQSICDLGGVIILQAKVENARLCTCTIHDQPLLLALSESSQPCDAPIIDQRYDRRSFRRMLAPIYGPSPAWLCPQHPAFGLIRFVREARVCQLRR